MRHLLPGLVSSLMGLSVLLTLVQLWPDRTGDRSLGGERALRRARALEKWPFLGIVFSFLGVVSEWLGSPVQEKRLRELLQQAGFPLGLNPEELTAACLLLAVAGGAGGVLTGSELTAGGGTFAAAVGMIMGIAWPLCKLDELGRCRIRDIGRTLPQAIDLIALSMRAGSDFTGAMEQIARRMHPDNPLRFEFEYILKRMSLGSSRTEALKDMARRARSVVVGQFVASVVQAEHYGTPLTDVLEIQAKVLRTRRSQMAEQAAARAAVLILGPMLLIFISVFVVLLGPFAIQFIRGELV